MIFVDERLMRDVASGFLFDRYLLMHLLMYL